MATYQFRNADKTCVAVRADGSEVVIPWSELPLAEVPPEIGGNRDFQELRAKRDAGEIEIADYAPAPIDLASYLAQHRWEVETGGILVSGISVATDDRSKIMISGARTKAKEDPAIVKRWKGNDGVFVTLNAAALITIADAVEAHVSACFELEADLAAEIVAGTITTPEQIDARFAVLPTLSV